MPELPEVETTRRGIAPHLLGQRVEAVHLRCPRLRHPVTRGLRGMLTGQTIEAVHRRAKYLLLRMERGTLLLHLGMSGTLRILLQTGEPGPHDHLDLRLENGSILRFKDPRRFGIVLWLKSDPLRHPLLRSLGPEPLSRDFDGEYLYQRSRGRRQAVKPFLMDSRVVAGVGNIYAGEALFAAGIHPARAAGRISRRRYLRLARALQGVLQRAIDAGGTTLRDFVGGDGRPGYFRIALQVYGREGQACASCATSLRTLRLGQRSTVFCPVCQR